MTGQMHHGGVPPARASLLRRAGATLPTLLGLLVVACTATVLGSTASAPAGTRDASAIADPALPGPYPVGVITRNLERASSTTGEPRLLETVIWYPASPIARLFEPDLHLRGVLGAPAATTGPFPVIVFSHGADSSPIQSTFLTAQLASHGFIVAAPSHPGSTVQDCLGCGTAERQAAMLHDSALNRPDDVAFVLNALARLNNDGTWLLHGVTDAAHAGVIGHSWGGYTAIVAAANDARFQVAVAMAPVVNDALEDAARSLHAPVLVMASRLDNITPFAAQEDLFTLLPKGTPRFLLTFPQGGHTAYSEICPPDFPGCRPGELGEAAHAWVNTYILAFLRVYLTGDDRYAPLLRSTSATGLLNFTAYDGPH